MQQTDRLARSSGEIEPGGGHRGAGGYRRVQAGAGRWVQWSSAVWHSKGKRPAGVQNQSQTPDNATPHAGCSKLIRVLALYRLVLIGSIWHTTAPWRNGATGPRGHGATWSYGQFGLWPLGPRPRTVAAAPGGIGAYDHSYRLYEHPNVPKGTH